jgi:hypothetical protein
MQVLRPQDPEEYQRKLSTFDKCKKKIQFYNRLTPGLSNYSPEPIALFSCLSDHVF